jgi:hypothetical protein
VTFALAGYRAALTPPWVRDPLWRRAQAVPSLDLRFAENRSLVDAVTGASLVTFTRASSGTFVNSAGVLQTATNDVPRFDHNPTTGESQGLLVEEQRSNLLLNSGTLSTQLVTVTAVAHTLSFTGTGTITLTGVSTAGPLVGTGTGEANRVSLTFTPTAGSLTLTVSGTVTNAQLEAGAFRTSYIATAGAAVTRSADVASITGSAFSSWYRQDAISVFCQLTKSTTATGAAFSINDITANNRISGLIATTSFSAARNTAGAGTLFTPSTTYAPVSGLNKLAQASTNLNHAIAGNGGTVATAATYNMPVVDRLDIGNQLGGTFLNGSLARLTVWPQALPSRLQSLTQ